MRFSLVALVVIALSFAPPALAATPSRAPCPIVHARRDRPLRVVDGDTFNLGGERIRLVGIDAPEVGQPGAGRATARLNTLLRSGPLTIVRHGRDVYCRTLADVYVSGISAAVVMRAEGLAKEDRAAVRSRRGGWRRALPALLIWPRQVYTMK